MGAGYKFLKGSCIIARFPYKEFHHGERVRL